MCRNYFTRFFSSGENCAGILEQSVGAKNLVGLWLSYRPARVRISKRIWSPGIDSARLESIPGLLKRLTITGSGHVG